MEEGWAGVAGIVRYVRRLQEVKPVGTDRVRFCGDGVAPGGGREDVNLEKAKGEMTKRPNGLAGSSGGGLTRKRSPLPARCSPPANQGRLCTANLIGGYPGFLNILHRSFV